MKKKIVIIEGMEFVEWSKNPPCLLDRSTYEIVKKWPRASLWARIKTKLRFVRRLGNRRFPALLSMRDLCNKLGLCPKGEENEY